MNIVNLHYSVAEYWQNDLQDVLSKGLFLLHFPISCIKASAFSTCAKLRSPRRSSYQKTRTHYSSVTTFALVAPDLQSAYLCVFRDEWSGTGLFRWVIQPTPPESSTEVAFICTGFAGGRALCSPFCSGLRKSVESVSRFSHEGEDTAAVQNTLKKHIF